MRKWDACQICIMFGSGRSQQPNINLFSGIELKLQLDRCNGPYSSHTLYADCCHPTVTVEFELLFTFSLKGSKDIVPLQTPFLPYYFQITFCRRKIIKYIKWNKGRGGNFLFYRSNVWLDLILRYSGDRAAFKTFVAVKISFVYQPSMQSTGDQRW